MGIFRDVSTLMDVKVKKSQRTNWRGQIIFILDARMEVPPREHDQIRKYGLGIMLIYDSANRKKHKEALDAHLESTKQHPGTVTLSTSQLLGIVKTFYRFLRAMMSLFMIKASFGITVNKLMKGVHIESKSLAELLAVEKEINESIETVRGYIEAAESFDGSEEVRGF